MVGSVKREWVERNERVVYVVVLRIHNTRNLDTDLGSRSRSRIVIKTNSLG